MLKSQGCFENERDNFKSQSVCPDRVYMLELGKEEL